MNTQPFTQTGQVLLNGSVFVYELCGSNPVAANPYVVTWALIYDLVEVTVVWFVLLYLFYVVLERRIQNPVKHEGF